MRRCDALRALSSEHHLALALAAQLRRAAGTPQAEKIWQETRQRFATELEPHFQAEEARLLPALERAGETGLAQRTRAEHAELRRMMHAGEMPDLPGFAELLAQHIRFEERELFEAAQRAIPPAALAALMA